MSWNSYSVSHLISLIGLLTAMEKQVVLGRLPANEAHSVALEKTLAYPGDPGPEETFSQMPSSSSTVVPGGRQPLQHALQSFIKTTNEGWAHTSCTYIFLS